MAADIKIAVTGAGGRMGRTLTRLIHETAGLALAGGIEAEGSSHLGADLGTLAGLAPLGLAATADALSVIKDADALVDFSVPAASVEFAALTAQARIVHVIGTTGFSEADEERIAAAARHATVIKAGNMQASGSIFWRRWCGRRHTHSMRPGTSRSSKCITVTRSTHLRARRCCSGKQRRRGAASRSAIIQSAGATG